MIFSRINYYYLSIYKTSTYKSLALSSSNKHRDMIPAVRSSRYLDLETKPALKAGKMPQGTSIGTYDYRGLHFKWSDVSSMISQISESSIFGITELGG